VVVVVVVVAVEEEEEEELQQQNHVIQWIPTAHALLAHLLTPIITLSQFFCWGQIKMTLKLSSKMQGIIFSPQWHNQGHAKT
jgi:hypothetical protein